MAQSPVTDYYLLGHQEKSWDAAQKEHLCDGIRELETNQVLIEFKYTESVNEEVLVKAAVDWIRYRHYKGLAQNDVKMVIYHKLRGGSIEKPIALF